MLAMSLAVPLAAPASEWFVRPDGIGTVRIGARFSALAIPFQQPVRTTDFRPDGRCFLAIADLPQKFDLMIEDGIVTMIDVLEPGVRTAEGIGVGDPVSDVWKAYGGRLRSTPNEYDNNERDLTVLSKDGRHAIRFYTARSKVSAFVAGRIKSVNYSEGCL
jgi:hypothetical protein